MRTDLLKKVKYWYKTIPTLLTLGNSLCGFGAILNTLNAYRPAANERIPELLAVSAWWIICAMIFDMLDGWTARRLNVSSRHGMQMDSLADMVTFGVAPAVIVAVMAHTNAITYLPYRWAWVFSAIYLGCTASRLALYNVMALENTSSDSFQGLPSPGGAAAVCSFVILYSKYSNHAILTTIAGYIPIYAAIIGLLMVSPLPYAHLGHWLGSKRQNKLKILAVIVFFILFSNNPQVVAAIASTLYVFSGPIVYLILIFNKRKG